MYNLPVAHVDGYMAAVADNIPCLGIFIADLLAGIDLVIGDAGQLDPKMAEYLLHKGAAVNSIVDICTAVHIGIADILTGIAYHVTAADTGGKGRVLTAALIRLLIIVPLRAGIGIISIGITAGISLVVIISIRAGIRIAAFIRIVCLHEGRRNES